MLRKKMLIGFLIVFAFSFFTVANAQSKESQNEKTKTELQQVNHKDQKVNEEKAAVKPWNEVCPVKGNKVSSETQTVDYNEKTYGFCCLGCDKKFAKDPEKYSKNLNEDGNKFIGKK